MVGYITAIGKVVTLPISSKLIKLAILPKKSPIGATNEMRSDKEKKLIFFILEKKICTYYYTCQPTMKRHSSFPYIKNVNWIIKKN